MEDGGSESSNSSGGTASNRNNKAAAEKQTKLEDLDREELLKRCKNYLLLAQRAKAAKDEAHQKEKDLLDRIVALESKVDALEEEKTAFHLRADGAVEEKANLAAQLADATSQLKCQEEECDSLQAKLAGAEENYGKQRDGFVEELNKMNDVLKQRGETITRLEEKCQTSEKEFKAKIETLLQSVAEREKRIEQLEMQSEAMSTSTISKAEEMHRMRDVEDSLEERYNKLKALAVRMKKKIAEQSAQLQAAPPVTNGVAGSLHAMQKDIDRLNDELDAKKAQMNIMKKDCDAAIQELSASRQKAEEYKDEASALRSSYAEMEKNKKALEKSLRESEERYDLAIKEHESDRILRLEISKECDRLKAEIRQLGITIEDLNRSQEAAKQESKKQSLLELEITDYEKTITDLNAQLDLLRKELKEKQNMTDRAVEEKSALLAQIQMMEQQVSAEQQRANESKTSLDSLRSQLEALRNQTEEQQRDIRQLTVKAESKGGEAESLRLELSTLSAELQKARTGSAFQMESLRRQVASLEEASGVERAAKEALQLRLSELQSEYDSYKVRATSVLKKQQHVKEPADDRQHKGDPSNGDFNTDQVEREMLQRVVEALKGKITELESEVAQSRTEVSNLRAERERTAASHLAALQVVQQRLEAAEKELEKARKEHQAQITRLQGDNQLLAALHREHVDGLKVRHAQEILALQSELDAAAVEAVRLQKLALQANHHRNASPIVVGGGEAMSMVERERGEGSEDGSVSSYGQLQRRRESSEGPERSPPPSRNKPIPLDELLSSALTSEEVEVIQQEESPQQVESQSPSRLSEALAVSEKRCHHLAALLAESEANEARLSQLTDALKEEIRRAERSEERQKHIENLEYLKNVVLKFVTLPRGEERSRLVPVLTTLLRLSPVEVGEVQHALNRSAEGAIRPAAWGGVFNYFAPNQ